MFFLMYTSLGMDYLMTEVGDIFYLEISFSPRGVSGLRKSCGRQECTTQYIQYTQYLHLGSVHAWHMYNTSLLSAVYSNNDFDLMINYYVDIPTSGCTDATCGGHTASRFSMPLTSLGAKKYYLGIFFKVQAHPIQYRLYSQNTV